MSHAGRVVAGFGHGDEHDFDDLVTSQHEINCLRSKVQQLQAECRRWQQVQSRQVRTVSGCDQQSFCQIAGKNLLAAVNFVGVRGKPCVYMDSFL